MLKRILFFSTFAPAVFAACVPVASSRILGRDLALADPRFAALPATLVAGFAAAPGTSRIFASAELERLAKANGIAPFQIPDLCFEIPVQQLKEEDALAAMRASLPGAAAVRIVELSKSPLPLGKLEFPPEGLDAASPSRDGVQMWRGFVRYSETRKATAWARVTITAQFTVVTAVSDLPADTRIDASSLRLETRTGLPPHEAFAARIEDVQGRASRRPVKAGAMIPAASLAEPPAIRRGDAVLVEVQSGTARLRFDAIAEGSARAGEFVELKNPINGKSFKARVDSASKAIVIVGGQQL